MGFIITIVFDVWLQLIKVIFFHHMVVNHEPSSFLFVCKLLILTFGIANTALIMKIKKEKERIDDFLKTNFMIMVVCLIWFL